MEEQDVIQDSSPEDVVQDSSPEGAVEESPASVEQPEKTVPYDRFKEVNDEKKYYQSLVQQLASRKEQGETQKEIEQDPYASMTAEEAHFYRNLDKRTRDMINREAQKISQPIVQRTEALAKQMSELMAQQFRSVNKDVEPNSQEEVEIAKMVSMGVPLDRATWAVMGPKRVESARKQKEAVKQTKVQQKIQANTETSSVGMGVPRGEKKSFREFLQSQMDAAGI